MKRKYILNNAISKARLSRILAKGIDLFIVLILSVLFYPVGLILSLIYLGVSDSLQEGQSVGKKLIGFSVISLEDGNPCSLKQSLIRNLPFLVPLFFCIIPLWGIAFAVLFGVPLIVLEFYLLFKLDSGHRLGDVMADTSVMGHDGGVTPVKKPKSSWFEENPSA